MVQEGKTKTNNNQIKPKQKKIKLKRKQQKISLPKNKVILTKSNTLDLFVKGLGKRAKLIGLFVEYAQCGCMKIITLMKPVFDMDVTHLFNK